MVPVQVPLIPPSYGRRQIRGSSMRDLLITIPATAQTLTIRLPTTVRGQASRHPPITLRRPTTRFPMAHFLVNPINPFTLILRPMPVLPRPMPGHPQAIRILHCLLKPTGNRSRRPPQLRSPVLRERLCIRRVKNRAGMRSNRIHIPSSPPLRRDRPRHKIKIHRRTLAASRRAGAVKIIKLPFQDTGLAIARRFCFCRRVVAGNLLPWEFPGSNLNKCSNALAESSRAWAVRWRSRTARRGTHVRLF